jgi:hypothetical protein
MLQFSVTNGGSANHQTAIANGIVHRLVFLSIRKKRLGTDCGNRFAKGSFVWRNDAKVKRAEIAHYTRCGADIQRIACADKHDTQVFQLNGVAQRIATIEAIVCELARRGTFRTGSPYIPLCIQSKTLRRWR